MFSTSLGTNDLTQINLNHWGERNNTKITHKAGYQNNLFSDSKHLGACLFCLSFFLIVCAQSCSSAMAQITLVV